MFSKSLWAQQLPKKLYHDSHSLAAPRTVKIQSSIYNRLAERHLHLLEERTDPVHAEVLRQLNPMMKRHQEELAQIERFAPKNEEA